MIELIQLVGQSDNDLKLLGRGDDVGQKPLAWFAVAFFGDFALRNEAGYASNKRMSRWGFRASGSGRYASG